MDPLLEVQAATANQLKSAFLSCSSLLGLVCTPSMTPPSENATAAVANAVMESMQESGEKDRVKEWLLEALESAGWTAQLHASASLLTANCDGKHDLSVKELAAALNRQGHGALQPSHVFPQLDF